MYDLFCFFLHFILFLFDISLNIAPHSVSPATLFVFWAESISGGFVLWKIIKKIHDQLSVYSLYLPCAQWQELSCDSHSPTLGQVFFYDAYCDKQKFCIYNLHATMQQAGIWCLRGQFCRSTFVIYCQSQNPKMMMTFLKHAENNKEFLKFEFKWIIESVLTTKA